MADDWMYFLQTSSCRHTFQTLFFFCYPLASDAKHSKVFVTQSCPTLCISIDCSPPGSTVHRILQARILEWVAFPFSRGSSQLEIEPKSPALQADSLLFEPPGKPNGNSCILLNPQSNITGREKDISLSLV